MTEISQPLNSTLKTSSSLRKAIPDTWTLCTGVPSFNEYVYGATGVTFDGKE